MISLETWYLQYPASLSRDLSHQIIYRLFCLEYTHSVGSMNIGTLIFLLSINRELISYLSDIAKMC